MDFISWRCIIAGLVVSLAISIIMAVLGVALGFTVMKPTSNKPFSGLGAAFGVWSIFSVIVSLAAGGFAAGYFSGVRGGEHGFMVWATVLIAGTLFSGLAVGAAVRMVGSVMHSIGSGAASVASTVGGNVHDMAQSAFAHVKDSANFDFDPSQLEDNIVQTLRDSGEEKLQPEYLRDQLREAKTELKGALHNLAQSPDSYDQVIGEFLDKQKSRLDAVTGEVDRDTAVNAIMKKRNIPKQEAEQAVDDALKVYNRAVRRAEHAITGAKHQFNETKAHLKAMSDRARTRAEEMSSTAAKSALAAAAALILGAVICCWAGEYGGKMTAANTIVIQERGIAVPFDAPLDRR